MAHLEDAIPGLAEFTRWFAEDATRYVVIGGVAREMIYREAGLWEESGTKDFDMVLIAEALDAPFVAKFIQFVREAHYTHVTKSGDAQMFRFCRPASSAYPHQIELLSRRPDYLEGIEARIGKVPVTPPTVCPPFCWMRPTTGFSPRRRPSRTATASPPFPTSICPSSK